MLKIVGKGRKKGYYSHALHNPIPPSSCWRQGWLYTLSLSLWFSLTAFPHQQLQQHHEWISTPARHKNIPYYPYYTTLFDCYFLSFSFFLSLLSLISLPCLLLTLPISHYSGLRCFMNLLLNNFFSFSLFTISQCLLTVLDSSQPKHTIENMSERRIRRENKIKRKWVITGFTSGSKSVWDCDTPQLSFSLLFNTPSPFSDTTFVFTSFQYTISLFRHIIQTENFWAKGAIILWTLQS